MERLTLVADPCTGLVYESDRLWNNPVYAYQQGRGDWRRVGDFRPLTPATRALETPDGCTVGDNAAWLKPGEWVAWDGPVAWLG